MIELFPGDMKDIHYRIYCCSTREPIEDLPMHVLAHAYHRAWQFLHGSDPQGKHVIIGLDLFIEFARPNAGEHLTTRQAHSPNGEDQVHPAPSSTQRPAR